MRVSRYILLCIICMIGLAYLNSPDRVVAAATYILQRGPYNTPRPTFSSPGGFEFYDTSTGTFTAIKPSEVLSASANQLNDSPIKPTRRLWSTAGNTTLNVGPLGTFSLKNGSAWRTTAVTTTTSFDTFVASSTCPNCTTMTTYGRYYVYIYDSSTLPAALSVAYDLSTTAPDASLLYKTSDKTRLYIGTVREDSNILSQFSARNGVYTYVSPYQVVNTTTSTNFAALDIAGTPPATGGVNSIPPHASSVFFRAEWTPNMAGDSLIFSLNCTIGTTAGSEAQVIRTTGAGGTIQLFSTTLMLIPNSIPCWRGSATMGQANFYVTGFVE